MGSKFICMLVVLVLGSLAQARQPTEADFLAARVISEDFAHWVSGLPNRPSSLGIFYIRTNAPFDMEYASVIESNLVKALQTEPNIQIASCNDCRTPQVEVRDDRLIIKKGAPDNKSLTELGKKLGVDSFLMADVYRTPISVIMNATIYQASSGQVVAAEEFKAPALDWSDSAMLVVINAGPAIVNGGRESTTTNNEFQYLASLSVLEEIGFGKGGLALGGVGAASKGNLFYADPTIGWRGHFGKTNIQSLLSVGVGYGYSNNVGGVSGRAAYEIFIGSFTNVGVEAVGMMPLRNGDSQPIGTAIGLHMGFSLGR